VILGASFLVWTNQFLYSRKLSFGPFSWSLLFTIASESSSTCMCLFSHQYESLLINDLTIYPDHSFDVSIYIEHPAS